MYGKSARKAYPLRLKTDLKQFIDSCAVRMNCHMQLKYAFTEDNQGVPLQDLAQVRATNSVGGSGVLLTLSNLPSLLPFQQQNEPSSIEETEDHAPVDEGCQTVDWLS